MASLYKKWNLHLFILANPPIYLFIASDTTAIAPQPMMNNLPKEFDPLSENKPATESSVGKNFYFPFHWSWWTGKVRW